VSALGLLILTACSGSEVKDDAGISGTVTAAAVSAEVAVLAGFGVDTQGRAALVLSSGADASCDGAAAWLLDGGSDEDRSPESILPGGTCAMYVSLPAYDAAAGLSVQDDATQATVSLSCAMGAGEWVYEERGAGDIGWYWTGDWWVGSPDGFSLEVAGGAEAPYDVTFSADAWNGSFTYDVENPDPDPATGAVSGASSASWCADMGPSLAR
jgi:hypothetical protein